MYADPYRTNARPPEKQTRRTLWGRLRSAWRRAKLWEERNDRNWMDSTWAEMEQWNTRARLGLKRRNGEPYVRLW